jgi:hypothetical protein
MTERCLKHKIFIPASGCPICKEIEMLKTDHLNAIIDKNLQIQELNQRINTFSKELAVFTKEATKEAEKLKITDEVKRGIHFLSRNEKSIFMNLFAAESIVMSVNDLYLQIPEKRRAEVEPFADYIGRLADVMNELDTELANKAVKAMGSKEYNELIIDAIRTLDAAGGKIKNCEVCIYALDRKRMIREELRQNKT